MPQQPGSTSDALSVDAIRDSPPAGVDPNSERLAREERDFLENEHLRSSLLDRKQDRKERLKYAKRIFILLVAWISALGVIIAFQGFGFRGFRLSDAVVLALVGSTTISVIGIFLIVANYLFPRSSHGRDSK